MSRQRPMFALFIRVPLAPPVISVPDPCCNFADSTFGTGRASGTRNGVQGKAGACLFSGCGTRSVPTTLGAQFLEVSGSIVDGSRP